MKKRTKEEMRDYQRKRRARLRGVTPEEQGMPPLTGLSDKLIDTHGSQDVEDWTVIPRIDEDEPF